MQAGGASALEFLAVLVGAGNPGGTAPSAWNNSILTPPMMPPPPNAWNELMWAREYPLAFFGEFPFAALLSEGRGNSSRHFSPASTTPVGLIPTVLKIEAAPTDESKVGRYSSHSNLSEPPGPADYVLPKAGHASERHDLMSQETHAARWIGFRQPVLRLALERQGRRRNSTSPM